MHKKKNVIQKRESMILLFSAIAFLLFIILRFIFPITKIGDVLYRAINSELLSEISIAYDFKGDLFVINGKGNDIYSREEMENYYFSSQINESGKVLVQRRNFSDKRDKMSNVLIIDPKTEKEVVALTSDNIASPIMSDDLNIIAYIQNEDLVIFDIEKNIEKVRIKTINPRMYLTDENKILWNRENELVIFNWSPNEIYKLNISNAKWNKICEGKITAAFLWGTKRKTEDEVDCLEHPEARMFFGDPENPARFILSSINTKDRFYFYRRLNETFPATKIWIEGYDRETRKTFHVKTIQSYFGDFASEHF
jgi:hypothetical protein